VYRQSRFSAITRTALRGARRHWMAIGIPIAVILILAYAIAFLIDEPLRRDTEAKMNHALKGYTARIGKLDFHPIGLSLDRGRHRHAGRASGPTHSPARALERQRPLARSSRLLSYLESDRDVSGEERQAREKITGA
jgi:hypothetical protein